MMKNLFTFLLLFVFAVGANAQTGLEYQKPPKEIVDLMNVNSTPGVSISP